jgi:hypothetical protein
LNRTHISIKDLNDLCSFTERTGFTIPVSDCGCEQIVEFFGAMILAAAKDLR